MANQYLSPNMSLVIPVPGQEPGPDWASDLNASLTILDGHSHSPGSGVQITPAGININADLPFNNSNNATQLRSVRFFPNLSSLSLPADLGCLYEFGVDLYYNDGSGNVVRITQSGSVTGSTGTITGLPSGTASASYQSISGTFQFQQATSTAANIDAASLIVRYPGSYPTPSGNAIIIEAPSSLASQYSLILPALPLQTNVMTLGTSGVISSVSFDAVGQTMTSVGADAIGQSMTSVGANAIQASTTRAVGSTVGTGGVAQSAAFTFATTGFALGPENITISTSGRPVVVALVSVNGNSPVGVINLASTDASALIKTGQVILANGSTRICTQAFSAVIGSGSINNGEIPPSSVWAIDFGVAGSPGTYTYQVFLNSITSNTTITIANCYLVAYEL